VKILKQRKKAIYSRKSKFTGKGESIENQIELCKEYIRVHHDTISEDDILIYEDEGFSGKNTGRPMFQKMMKDAKAGKIDSIICYRLDRISRNIGDFANLIEELSTLNISFISIKEQFDTSTPMGRAMMFIASVFSQLERETIAERIRDNMHELAKTGRWLGGTTPLGFESEDSSKIMLDGKVRKSCWLKGVPNELTTVKTIFKEFNQLDSLTKTEYYLTKNGFKTRNDNDFSRFAIRNILTNPVYLTADEDAYNYLVSNNAQIYSDLSEFDGTHGIMVYNRTLQEQGKAIKIRPMDEWIIAVGKHNGTITGKDWIHTQELLAKNSDKNFHKPKSHIALLSGLLRCGKCQDYMRPKSSRHTDKNGNKLFSYLCTTKEKSHLERCDIKNPNGNILDAMVVEKIKELSKDNTSFMNDLRHARELYHQHTTEYDASLEQLQTAYTENETAIQTLVTSLSSTPESTAQRYITAEIDKLHNKGEEILNRIKEIEGITKTNRMSDNELDVLKEMLDSFNATADSMSLESKRLAIRTFVQKVVWDGENVHLYLFGSINDEEIVLPLHNPTSENDSAITEPLGENRK